MLLTTLLVVYVLYAISYDGDVTYTQDQEKVLVVAHNRDLIKLDIDAAEYQRLTVQSWFNGKYSTILDTPVTWLDMVSVDAYLNINPHICLGLRVDYPIPPKRLYIQCI